MGHGANASSFESLDDYLLELLRVRMRFERIRSGKNDIHENET